LTFQCFASSAQCTLAHLPAHHKRASNPLGISSLDPHAYDRLAFDEVLAPNPPNRLVAPKVPKHRLPKRSTNISRSHSRVASKAARNDR
jgi:hypothetical protein